MSNEYEKKESMSNEYTMSVNKNTHKEQLEFLSAKEKVEEIVLRFAHTQNSFVNEDGSNGYDEMLEQLAILVTTLKSK